MIIAELKAALDRAGAPFAPHSDGTEIVVDSLALSNTRFGKWWPEGKWCVYYLSHGTRTSRWCFDSELAARENLVKRVLRIVEWRKQYGRMNRDDVRGELNRSGISSGMYDLDNLKYADGREVLKEDADSQWLVYSDERGKMLELASFDSETKACECLLDRIFVMVDRFGATK